MHNNTVQSAFLSSLMAAGAHLEPSRNDLASHANDRTTAALALAKHAKEAGRQLRLIGIRASTPGIQHLAEEGEGCVTFSLVY